MLDITKITPVRSLILLDTTPQEETTASGIIIPVAPDHAKLTVKPKVGTIVAVGPEANKIGAHKDEKGNCYFFAEDPGFVPGLKVIVRQYATDQIYRDGRRYHFAEAHQVVAIIKEDAQ